MDDTDATREDGGEGHGPAPQSSILAALQQQYERIETEQKSCFLPIPGWNGILVAEYGVLDGPTLGGIAKAARRQGGSDEEIMIRAMADTIMEGVIELYYSDGTKRMPLREATGAAEPVKFDLALAEFLNWNDIDSMTDLFYKLFGNNDSHIVAHATEYSRWLGDTSTKVGETFLGEISQRAG